METQAETSAVPREQWTGWFEAFGNAHRHWIVDVEIIGEHVGDPEASIAMLPLERIAASDATGRVEISAGIEPGGARTHVVERVHRVWFKEPDIPGHESIAIRSADGTTTILHFQHVDPDQLELQLTGRDA